MKDGVVYQCGGGCTVKEFMITVEPDKPFDQGDDEDQEACEYCPFCGGQVERI